jgi:hypothetical protein
MKQEECHSCEIDAHCDDIQHTIAELEREKEMLRETQQDATDSVPQLIILENLPKITPASAKRETGAKVGTRGDINIGMVDKRGYTVEKAAERLLELYGPNAEGILPPEFDEYRIRTEIIDILKMGRANYRAQFITPIGELEREIEDKEEQLQDECLGQLPEVDLEEYQRARALAVAMIIKYKYAA